MKPWALASLTACAAAFPSFEHAHKAGIHSHKKLNKDSTLLELQAQVLDQLKEKQHEKRLLVSSSDKPIEVTGEHAFYAPDFENGDQRGPCPGLNALANHGYIPRSGVVSFTEAISAANEVFGMGLDLALLLTTMGTVWTGNPLSLSPSFSIGGRDTGINNLLGNGLGLLGEPQGLNGSHNLIESDSSNTRDDLYVTGDASTMNETLFMEWYDSFDEDGTFSMDMMADRAAKRFQESKASNPDFFYGPVTGLFARNAGYAFNVRLLGNYSVEEGEQVLTKEIARSFYGMTGTDEDGLTYTKGHERIPEGWHRRPVDYGMLDLNVDLLGWAMKYPELASIGGNTGTVNSFTGIDVSDLTGGVLNATTLLEGNNLLCFVFQALKLLSPNALGGIYKTLAVPLDLITKALAAPLVDLACPAFEDLQVGGEPAWEALEELFPGALLSGSVL
ncbi:hypothetical protein BDW74DRAFT_184083 [Aspergillus multicolor]|uniref:peroxidase family protein n=1 Tax=Aspergillus multicolor TaxID=41759 RepID=UPI003CCD8217